ncbi:uncharacterized protein LOC62_01G000588 [Vanrija pseudolonga]|uniref:ABC-type Fe3+ transport system n=1 Tax=Vanrija pseudolonga TaxID=143232 RepID=A0AAF0XZG9_9TREE|nr:hypothetical protein LOC62_01G000588 [Vanrija pseudolonga]
MRLSLSLLALLGTVAADSLFAFNSSTQVETRSLDELHQAALAEGGTVVLWHGGDLANGGDDLKKSFEARFPGVTLNVTIDLSKYHDGRVDQGLASNGFLPDSVILQTLQDYPRWDVDGALLRYKPAGFDAINPAYKDPFGAWYGVYVYSWSFIWSSAKLPNVTIAEFADFLKPELKDKLVLTYPHDDDAVLYAFDLALRAYGAGFLDQLIAQNPRWVRGTGTPSLIIQNSTFAEAATFTSDLGYAPVDGIGSTKPATGPFVSWAQTAAILKDAPHPEGAKLLHNYILSPEYQNTTGWQVREDLPLPQGFPYAPLDKVNNTNPVDFARWMEDRGRVERLRFWFEAKLGTAQGVSPLIDPLS